MNNKTTNTEKAYQEALKKYIGRKTTFSPGSHSLTCLPNSGEITKYSVDLTIDSENKISGLSRLTAQALLWVIASASDWEPCPIEPIDYDWALSKMLDKYLIDEEN